MNEANGTGNKDGGRPSNKSRAKMIEDDLKEFYREQAIASGLHVVDAVLGEFRFIVKRLEEEQTRYAELIAMDAKSRAGEPAEQTEAEVISGMVAILGQVAKSSSNPSDAHLARLVEAAAKIGAAAGIHSKLL